MSAYYSLVIIGLCLLMGYAGQISIGHAGFFAIGGYISAFLTTHDLSPLKSAGSRFIPFEGRSAWARRRPLRRAAASLSALGGLHRGRPFHHRHRLPYRRSGAETEGPLPCHGDPRLRHHRLPDCPGDPFFGAADGLSDVPPFRLLPGP